MRLIGVRFVALMLAALTLGMGLAHLMQLPARMSWDQYLWVGSTVQGGLYSLFGSVGAVDLRGHRDRARSAHLSRCASITRLASDLRSPPRFCSRPGFCCGGCWSIRSMSSWRNGSTVRCRPIGPTYRARWEWGHAIISLFELSGFAALIASVLADTPRNNRSALTYGWRACRRRAPLP